MSMLNNCEPFIVPLQVNKKLYMNNDDDKVDKRNHKSMINNLLILQQQDKGLCL